MVGIDRGFFPGLQARVGAETVLRDKDLSNRVRGAGAATLTKAQLEAVAARGVQAALDRVQGRTRPASSAPPALTAAKAAQIGTLMEKLAILMSEELHAEVAGTFGEYGAAIIREELKAAAQRVVERLAAELAAQSKGKV